TGLALDSYLRNLSMVYSHSQSEELLIEALNVIEFAKNQNFNNQLISAYLSNDTGNSNLIVTEKSYRRKLAELERNYVSASSEVILDSIVTVSHQIEQVKSQIID